MENKEVEKLPKSFEAALKAIYFPEPKYMYTDSRTVSIKNKQELAKYYVENLSLLNGNLDEKEKKVLHALLLFMNVLNKVIIGGELKEEIAHSKKLSKSSINRAISGLLDKKILLYLNTPELKKQYEVYNNKSYIVDPNLVGKGGLRSLEIIRQVEITEFDFEKLEYDRKIERSFFYDGYKELEKNPSDFEIKEVNHSVNGKNSSTDIIIENKEPSSEVQNVLELKPNLVENKELEAKKKAILEGLFKTDGKIKNNDEQVAAIMAIAGSCSGLFHPTKSVKEMKMQAVQEDIERIDNQDAK